MQWRCLRRSSIYCPHMHVQQRPNALIIARRLKATRRRSTRISTLVARRSMWLFYNTNTFKRQLNKYKIPKRCKRPVSQTKIVAQGSADRQSEREREREWGRHPSKRFIQPERFINSSCTFHVARCRLAAWNVLAVAVARVCVYPRRVIFGLEQVWVSSSHPPAQVSWFLAKIF